MSNIYYLNFPETLSNIKNSSDHDNTPSVLLMKETVGTDAPMLLYFANNMIPGMDTVHSPEAVDYLNRRGVHIFLYEPLCSYMVDWPENPYDKRYKHNFGFYSEFYNEHDDYDKIRAPELDSIEKYIDLNRLTNVHVYTCEYRVAQTHPYYLPKMKLHFCDMFLKALPLSEKLLNLREKTMGKHFICSNWRYTTSRAFIASILASRYRKQSYISWKHNTDVDTLMNQCVYTTTHQGEPLYKRLYASLMDLTLYTPMTIDFTCNQSNIVTEHAAHHYPSTDDGFNKIVNPVLKNPFDLPLWDFYMDSFVDIVTESRFAQPAANISEKVTQAIQFMTPFILVAPPRSLELMKSMGYKTFSNWWDESYDTELDHYKRLEMIVALIDDIATWDADRMRSVYLDMIPTLQHNFENLIKTTRWGHVVELPEWDAQYHAKQYETWHNGDLGNEA